MSELNLEQKYNKWIIAVSIIIPVAVAFFGVKLKDFGYVELFLLLLYTLQMVLQQCC
jgi:hypothetical protein